MAKNDPNYKHKKKQSASQPATEGDEGGSDGQAGAIEFHDFLGTGASSRDDTMSPAEKKRLLSVHNGMHESLVEKQKSKREERKALKEGKVSLKAYREGMQATSSQLPGHPVLSNQAQFSGMDPSVNIDPNINQSDTNPENRNELQNKYNLTHRPGQAPKFNPTPQR